MLTTWFASKERGTYWGLWNIAHNLGGFIAPIVAGTAAGMLGWRWGMWVPGIAGIAMGFYAFFATSDSPEKEGYEPVEVIKEKPKKKDAEKEEGVHVATSYLTCGLARTGPARGARCKRMLASPRMLLCAEW